MQPDKANPDAEPTEEDDVATDNCPDDSSPTLTSNREKDMYGIIGQMMATDGNREKLIGILMNGIKDMPGCKLYAIAADASDEVSIWITEIWDSEESHKASLQLPGVQAAIAQGRPLIAGFGDRHMVKPVGGLGVA
jgi:quinol monooxygenase YgiN